MFRPHGCQSRILPCQTIFPYTYHILSNRWNTLSCIAKKRHRSDCLYLKLLPHAGGNVVGFPNVPYPHKPPSHPAEQQQKHPYLWLQWRLLLHWFASVQQPPYPHPNNLPASNWSHSQTTHLLSWSVPSKFGSLVPVSSNHVHSSPFRRILLKKHPALLLHILQYINPLPALFLYPFAFLTQKWQHPNPEQASPSTSLKEIYHN